MKTKLVFVLVLCMIALSGCYIATTETERMPSQVTITDNFTAPDRNATVLEIFT